MIITDKLKETIFTDGTRELIHYYDKHNRLQSWRNGALYDDVNVDKKTDLPLALDLIRF
jgi:hypothetical protein